MTASIFGALKYLPATLARKVLTKVNPSFENYFSKAISYGIDANRALDYVIDRFESSAQKDHKNALEKGAANKSLRPDEMVSRSEIGNAELPGKALKGALAFGLGGALAGGKRPIVEEEVEEIAVPQMQEDPREMQRREALTQFNNRMKKPPAEMSRESIVQQFEQAEKTQGKEALLNTMKEITESLRRMRGNG
jgi:hypothetical protein